MTVYVTAFAVATLTSFFSLSKDFPARPAGFVILSVLALVVGLRYASGDYFSYQAVYQTISDISNLRVTGYPIGVLARVEPGFAAFVLLEKALFGSFYAFIFIFGLVSVLIKYYAFRELSPFIVLSALIYVSDTYFLKDLGQIRNAMASGLVLASVLFAHRREPLKFLVTVVLAVSVHAVALVALPLYFFAALSSRILLTGALGLSVGVAMAGGAGSFLPELAAWVGLGEASRIVRYAASEYADGISVFGGTFLIHLLLSVVFIVFRQPLVNRWAYNEHLIPMYVYGTALMFMFIDYGIIASRIREMLCVPAAAVLLPSLVLLFRGNERLVPYALIVGYCAIWFYALLGQVYRYQNVLFAV